MSMDFFEPENLFFNFDAFDSLRPANDGANHHVGLYSVGTSGPIPTSDDIQVSQQTRSERDYGANCSLWECTRCGINPCLCFTAELSVPSGFDMFPGQPSSLWDSAVERACILRLVNSARDLRNVVKEHEPVRYAQDAITSHTEAVDGQSVCRDDTRIRPVVREGETKGKRTFISDVAKRLLEGEFFKSAYLNQAAEASLLSRTSLSIDTIPCTWPHCDKTFKTRFEWARHEDALHYCPYRWVCCGDGAGDQMLANCFVCHAEWVKLGHITGHENFERCRKASEADRTFLRSDQLAQHLKLVHGVQKMPRKIEKAWKQDNPAFNRSYLECGFCGCFSATWEQRRDHVFAHLKKGDSKESWWLTKVPFSRPPAWSCRVLADPRSIVQTWLWSSFAICSLCDTSPIADVDAHVNAHKLGMCERTVFLDSQEFSQHLEDEHWAEKSWFDEPKVLKLFKHQ